MGNNQTEKAFEEKRLAQRNNLIMPVDRNDYTDFW